MHPQCWLKAVEIQFPNSESPGGSWGSSWSTLPLPWETHYRPPNFLTKAEEHQKLDILLNLWETWGDKGKIEGLGFNFSSVSTTNLKSKNYSRQKVKLIWFPRFAQLTNQTVLRAQLLKTQSTAHQPLSLSIKWQHISGADNKWPHLPRRLCFHSVLQTAASRSMLNH